MRRDPDPVRRALPVLVLLLAVFALVVLLAAGCSGSGAASPVGGQTTSVPAGSAAPTAGALQPVTGAPTSGDPYYPSSGNGGYEVQDYQISLDIDPAANSVFGQTVVTATAVQDLAAFYLDFIGLKVSAVTVDGASAEFKRKGDKLLVMCPRALVTGARFAVAVLYSGVPKGLKSKRGWQKDGDTIYTLDEAVGSACWYPLNESPADKATYTFRLTVPLPYTATASGILAATETQGVKQTFVWKMEQPMACYLAAITVGRYVASTSKSPAGVVIRDYAAPELAAAVHTGFARTGEVLDYFATLFGPYPFAAYGIVAPDADTDGAMENQSLALFGRDFVSADPGAAIWGLSHELAHQWFGDSVGIKRWDDVWLNEGFATYATWLWMQHDQGEQAYEAEVQKYYDKMAASDEPPPGDPGTRYLFSEGVYYRGALTLQALRLTVGDQSFFRVLRTWADRYKYANAETADLIALVKEAAPQVAPTAIDALFQAWLHGKRMPALPSPAGASASGQ